METNEFLKQELKPQWFSALIWNSCLFLNIKKVQDLVDVFSSKNTERYRNCFGTKSKKEIALFFKKNGITIEEHGTKEMTATKEAVHSLPMNVN